MPGVQKVNCYWLCGCAARLTDRPSADISDLDLVDRLSGGRVDLTYGR